jgi:hypothetical protein
MDLPIICIQGRIQCFHKWTRLGPEVNRLEASSLLRALERANLLHCRTCRAFPDHYQKTGRDQFLKLRVLRMIDTVLPVHVYDLIILNTCSFPLGYTGMNNHTVVHQSGLGRVTNHSYWALKTVYDRADQLAALGRLNNYCNTT